MEQARALQRAYGIKVRDSIHIASALFAEADVIETYDQSLLALDSRIPRAAAGGGPSGPIRIQIPYRAPDPQQALFES